MWNAKKSVLPSITMGDIDYSSEDEESSIEGAGPDKDDEDSEFTKAL